MNTVKLSDRYDMDELHDKLQHAAREREQLPTADLAEIARVASRAFHDARNRVADLEYARARANADLERSSGDSAMMFSLAFRELDEDKTSRVKKREFASEFLSAAVLPVIAAAGVIWLAISQREVAAKAVFLGVSIVFLTATVFAIKGALQGSRISGRLGSWGGVLVNSGGSLFAGLCVFILSTILARDYGERQMTRELDARLDTVNQAAAVTLAALQANASVEITKAAVLKSTSADWIDVLNSPRSQGEVLVSASLPRTQVAELRLASAAQQPPRLETFLRSKSGESEQLADYFIGTVVKADLDEVTLQVVLNEDAIVFALPAGTLPPPVGSEVVVGVTGNDNTLAFIQPIDAIVEDLKR